MHTKLNTALRLMAPRQEFLQVLQQVSKKNPSSQTVLIISSQMPVTLAKNNY